MPYTVVFLMTGPYFGHFASKMAFFIKNQKNPQKQLFLAKLLEIPKPYTTGFFVKPGYPPGKNQKSPHFRIF